jgi:hypothetical protein
MSCSTKGHRVAMHDVTALRVVETLKIETRQAIADPQVARLREEHVVVHESIASRTGSASREKAWNGVATARRPWAVIYS